MKSLKYYILRAFSVQCRTCMSQFFAVLELQVFWAFWQVFLLVICDRFWCDGISSVSFKMVRESSIKSVSMKEKHIRRETFLENADDLCC